MDDDPQNLPTMAPYARHVLFCTGRYCDPEGKAEALYRALPRLLGDLGRYDNPQRVKRGTCPCLGVCYGGPIAVVYPDGIWYHVPDEAALKRIVEEHLYGGRPVEPLIFHRLAEPVGQLHRSCPTNSPSSAKNG